MRRPEGRRARRVVTIATALGLAVAGVGGWALAWPGPTEPLRCAAGDPEPCSAVSGRIVWIPRKDRSDQERALHLMLASRDSEAAPGISLVKIPPEMRPEDVPPFGRWVSAVGRVQPGSRGFDDVHVSRIRWGR